MGDSTEASSLLSPLFMRFAIILLALISTLSSAEALSRPMRFQATAYAESGVTAKGTFTHPGVVAADPSVLPLGSVIEVSRAGPYSGTYVVTDTGSKIIGHHIDVYMPSHHKARLFGRKLVMVRVVSWGDNKRDHREVTPLSWCDTRPGAYRLTAFAVRLL